MADYLKLLRTTEKQLRVTQAEFVECGVWRSFASESVERIERIAAQKERDRHMEVVCFGLERGSVEKFPKADLVKERIQQREP